ncbi:Protein FAM73A [Gossypium arboreum]|uniref:Protein FAM73A n=1 Tax=Gossypium arboreum TaxID=29729 RepID=A0A0B0MPX6_GOSAR|nr:Protein FAM73A [Gossypium arboreum]
MCTMRKTYKASSNIGDHRELSSHYRLLVACFCPHEQRQGHVSQPCATHSHVTRPCAPWVPFELKSVYPTGLARPRHTGMSIGHVWHTGWHMRMWSAM